MLKDLAEVKMGEQQLILTDYHKRLVEGIPMEEYAQGDPVTGTCPVIGFEYRLE